MTPESLYDPRTMKDLPVHDIRSAVANITKMNPISPESVERFRSARRKLVQIVDVTRERYRYSAIAPRPSGVAVGTYYDTNAVDFRTKTSIYWGAVGPESLGGSSTSLLYLTSSNLAAKGTESLIAYNDPATAQFRVWDWASPHTAMGQFVVNIPYQSWGDHLIQSTIGGNPHPSLYIVNRTINLGGDQWQNDVFLFNGNNQAFDLVWSYVFTWVPLPGGKYFGWGPIIEVFDTNYGKTNKIGYLGARLVTDTIDSFLLPAISFPNFNSGYNFTPYVFDANYTILAD